MSRPHDGVSVLPCCLNGSLQGDGRRRKLGHDPNESGVVAIDAMTAPLRMIHAADKSIGRDVDTHQTHATIPKNQIQLVFFAICLKEERFMMIHVDERWLDILATLHSFGGKVRRSQIKSRRSHFDQKTLGKILADVDVLPRET